MDFNFNDIMDSVTELADNAVKLAKDVASKTGKKTEEIVGVSKLKLDTLKLENDIKVIKQKLGSAVYEMTEQGCNDAQVIDQYVAELKTKYAQLEELKKQAAAMKKTVVCEACKSINPKESFFCSRCGAPLPVSSDDCEVKEACCCEEEAAEECCCEAECCVGCDEQEILEQAQTDGADEAQAAEVAEEAKTEE